MVIIIAVTTKKRNEIAEDMIKIETGPEVEARQVKIMASSNTLLSEDFEKWKGHELIYSCGNDDDVCCFSSMRNGLVGSIFDAYCNHHNLVLRPDDFWLTIVSQFSLYMNNYAEELRDKFVDFDEKKELVLKYSSESLRNFDFSIFITDMKGLIAENIKNPEFTDWIVPDFTTTTEVDKLVGKVILMSSLQEYFDYGCILMCGIPNVTLLGDVSDWVDLREKVDGLLKYDVDGYMYMSKWHSMLIPILDDLILTASGKEPKMEDFWQRSCDYISFGSGPKYLSGWVTVFNVFSDKGVWRGDCHPVKVRSPKNEGFRFIDMNDNNGRSPKNEGFPIIDTNDITRGIVTVPVTVLDIEGEHKTTMFAGSFLSEVSDDAYTIQPRMDLGLYL